MESSERIHKALAHFTSIMIDSLLMAHTLPPELLLMRIDDFLLGVESALTKEEFSVFYDQSYKLLLKVNEGARNGL